MYDFRIACAYILMRTIIDRLGSEKAPLQPSSHLHYWPTTAFQLLFKSHGYRTSETVSQHRHELLSHPGTPALTQYVSTLACLIRSDFNYAVIFFCYFAWQQRKDRISLNIVLVLLFSCSLLWLFLLFTTSCSSSLRVGYGCARIQETQSGIGCTPSICLVYSAR